LYTSFQPARHSQPPYSYQPLNPYSKRRISETQSTIKKFIRKFYKYLLGDGINYPKLVQFIDTSTRIPEVSAISKEENDSLIAHSSKIQHKMAFAFLFDSGARVREFYNIKLADLKKEQGVYKVRLRVSKTRPRTINLPLYTDIIDSYLKQQRIEYHPREYLFDFKYESLRKMMSRLGKRVLGKKVYPHLLRHSSATYYSKYVSRYQLCYRYGWSASSKMPDRYIDMNGLVDDAVLEKVQKNEITKIEQENTKLKESVQVMESMMKDLIKKQEESERREEIRKKESIVINTIHESGVSNKRTELLQFLKKKPDILQILTQIKEMMENSNS